MKFKQSTFALFLTTAIALATILSLSIRLWPNRTSTSGLKGKAWMERARKAMKDNQVDTAFRYFSLVADRYAEQRTDSGRTQAVLAMNNCGYISLFHLMNYAQSYSYLITALDLAELVESNTSYVSRTVNATYGCNFSTMLSTLRIREACRRINTPERYGQYTLETISESVGFKSRATFLTAFKRVTGLLPSEYQRQARNQKPPQEEPDLLRSNARPTAHQEVRQSQKQT